MHLSLVHLRCDFAKNFASGRAATGLPDARVLEKSHRRWTRDRISLVSAKDESVRFVPVLSYGSYTRETRGSRSSVDVIFSVTADKNPLHFDK